jgi:hypothetical protein
VPPAPAPISGRDSSESNVLVIDANGWALAASVAGYERPALLSARTNRAGNVAAWALRASKSGTRVVVGVVDASAADDAEPILCASAAAAANASAVTVIYDIAAPVQEARSPVVDNLALPVQKFGISRGKLSHIAFVVASY